MKTPTYTDLERRYQRLARLRKATRAAQQDYFRAKVALDHHRRASGMPKGVTLVPMESNGRRDYGVLYEGTVVGSITDRSGKWGQDWTADGGTFTYYNQLDAVWAVLDDSGTTEEIERAD